MPPSQDVDPKNLASSGWGVIFAPGISGEIQEALGPLLKRRSEAAGNRFRIYHPTPSEISSKERFLAACKVGPGPADPRRVPYYLLIVGSPEEISFRFQAGLDVQYAVGRIHFTEVASYAAYAENVIKAERAENVDCVLPPKQMAIFGVSRPADGTARCMEELVKPLAEMLVEERPRWPLKLFIDSQATKQQLSCLLGSGQTPSILFISSHGIGFPLGEALQQESQGAIICQDWPGPGHEVLPEHCFSAKDLANEADLRGLIVFHFACFSGGTPGYSSYIHSSLSRPQPLAPTAFVSPLAQRILSHPRGALAVVGHIDKAWTTSFSWSELGQIHLFEDTLKRLLDGFPVGFAMEFFNQRHAELAVDYADLCQDRDWLLDVDDLEFSRIHRAYNDAKYFVVLGDPAVKPAFRPRRKVRKTKRNGADRHKLVSSLAQG